MNTIGSTLAAYTSSRNRFRSSRPDSLARPSRMRKRRPRRRPPPPAPVPDRPWPCRRQASIRKARPGNRHQRTPGARRDLAAGMRSYWHCHAGGQIMMLFDGTGRSRNAASAFHAPQGRHRICGPGHRALARRRARRLGAILPDLDRIGRGYWMEEVGSDDYMGNDIGITSRNEFLRTGVRKKSEQLIVCRRGKGRRGWAVHVRPRHARSALPRQ